MIEKMHKYAFLVHHQQHALFVEQMQELGMLHIEVKKEGVSENSSLIELMADLEKTNALLKLLSKRVVEVSTLASVDQSEITAIEIEESLQLYKDADYLKTSIAQDNKEIEKLSPWGNIENEKIERLSDAGWKLQCFVCPTNKYDEEWEDAYNSIVVAKHSQSILFITLTPLGQEFELPCEKFYFPEKTLSEMKLACEEKNKQLQEIEEKLDTISIGRRDAIINYCNQLQENIDFKTVQLSSDKLAEERVMYIEGWVPESFNQDVLEFLDKQPIVYHTEKAKVGDDVPINLKNGSFPRLFEPISKMFMLPKYGELDLTPFFAPFFLLFFGFCLSDAGYGLLILIGLLFALLKVKDKNMRSIIYLGLYLGGATVLFGALTGTFLGIDLSTSSLPALQNFKDKFITGNKLMALAIGLGVVQLLFGMILKIVNLIRVNGLKHAVGATSWLILLLGSLVNAILMQLKGIEFINTPYLILIAISALGIFFYNSPGKGAGLNIGLGLWDTYNMAVGTLGDLLSYIRLFALGMASGMLGGAFNQIGTMCYQMDIPVINIVLMIVVLLVGHGVNIFMSGIGSLVHPLRLTFVEFYKAAGFEGGGRAYIPFKKKTTY